VNVHRALAPAKLNLGLFVGMARTGDSRHGLATVMQSVSLADELTLEPAGRDAGADQLHCPGLPVAAGENLAAMALSAFRAATGWDAGPLRVSIRKRIPVAAGLGGGSADAAATLRLAARASGVGGAGLLRELAADLGADVPAQVAPGRWLATGAGERLAALPDPTPALGVLILPLRAALSTAAVYAEADRLGPGRPAEELAEREQALRAALAEGTPLPAAGELLVNDLQAAAISLCPQIADSLEQARGTGAAAAFVSGSGPTVVGLFAGSGGPALAERAAASLAGRTPEAVAARSVDRAFACAVDCGRAGAT
jgi:4-diphosphocytidyl-2-C-methyl-D-erythritol kinase